ncbi:LOW QUALITY PROTEIN: hypothetical protein ACHAW5_004782 [Stephanodiscus triporus]|uniref:Uncharacterized protein n=1 Tax=Stephanodiscus triporus TaxID=2934178 RepID=A0ABD3QZ89_9STRA
MPLLKMYFNTILGERDNNRIISAMVNSPPQSFSSNGGGERRRPSTPHPSANGFAFENSSESPKSCCRSVEALDADANIGTDFHAKSSPGRCTFRESLENSQSASATPACDQKGDNILHRFHRFRSRVQRTLTCATNIDELGGIDDLLTQHDYRYDYDELEREKSLIARAASWATQETEIGASSLQENHRVQFHYPPITSVRLRPRTESDEIDQLFFAPEELDEIEDDRLDAMATDDVETLAVGHIHGSTSSSVVSSFDFDDQDSASAFMFEGSGYLNVMTDISETSKISKADNISKEECEEFPW